MKEFKKKVLTFSSLQHFAIDCIRSYQVGQSEQFLTTVFISWKLTTLQKETLYLAPGGVL
jgi:hypothetical protein